MAQSDAPPSLELCGDRKRFAVPVGLKCLLEELSREVLRHQPSNINEFLANYLEQKLRTQEEECGKEGDTQVQPPCEEKQAGDPLCAEPSVPPQGQPTPTCGGPSGEFVAPDSSANTGTTGLDPNLIRGPVVNPEAPFGYGLDGMTPCAPYGRDRYGHILTTLNPTAPFGFHPFDGLPIATNDPTAPFGFSPSGNPLTSRDPNALLGYDVRGVANTTPETVAFCGDSIQNLTNLSKDHPSPRESRTGQSSKDRSQEGQKQGEKPVVQNVTASPQQQQNQPQQQQPEKQPQQQQAEEECSYGPYEPESCVDSRANMSGQGQEQGQGQNQVQRQNQEEPEQSQIEQIDFFPLVPKGQNKGQQQENNEYPVDEESRYPLVSQTAEGQSGQDHSQGHSQLGQDGTSQGQQSILAISRKGSSKGKVHVQGPIYQPTPIPSSYFVATDEQIGPLDLGQPEQPIEQNNQLTSNGTTQPTTTTAGVGAVTCGPCPTSTGQSEGGGVMYIGGPGTSMLLSYDPARVTSVQPPINHMANACTSGLQVGGQVGVIDCAEIIRQAVESMLGRVMSIMSGIMSQNQCNPIPNCNGVIRSSEAPCGSNNSANNEAGSVAPQSGQAQLVTSYSDRPPVTGQQQQGQGQSESFVGGQSNIPLEPSEGTYGHLSLTQNPNDALEPDDLGQSLVGTQQLPSNTGSNSGASKISVGISSKGATMGSSEPSYQLESTKISKISTGSRDQSQIRVRLSEPTNESECESTVTTTAEASQSGVVKTEGSKPNSKGQIIGSPKRSPVPSQAAKPSESEYGSCTPSEVSTTAGVMSNTNQPSQKGSCSQDKVEGQSKCGTKKPSQLPILIDAQGKRKRCIPDELRPYIPDSGACGTSTGPLDTSSNPRPPVSGATQGPPVPYYPSKVADCCDSYEPRKPCSHPCSVKFFMHKSTVSGGHGPGNCPNQSTPPPPKCPALCAQKCGASLPRLPPSPPGQERQQQPDDRLSKLKLTKAATTISMGDYIEGILARASDIMKACGACGSGASALKEGVTKDCSNGEGKPPCEGTTRPSDASDKSEKSELGKKLQELAPQIAQNMDCPLDSDEQITLNLLTTVGNLLDTIEATGLTQMDPVKLCSDQTLVDLADVSDKLLIGLRSHLNKLSAKQQQQQPQGPVKTDQDCSDLFMTQITREAHEALGLAAESLELSVGLLKDVTTLCGEMSGHPELIQKCAQELEEARKKEQENGSSQPSSITGGGTQPGQGLTDSEGKLIDPSIHRHSDGSVIDSSLLHSNQNVTDPGALNLDGTAATDPAALNLDGTTTTDPASLHSSGTSTDLTTHNTNGTTTHPADLNSSGTVTDPASLNSHGQVTDPASLESNGQVTGPASVNSNGQVTDPASLNSHGQVTDSVHPSSAGTGTENVHHSSAATHTTNTKLTPMGTGTENSPLTTTATDPVQHGHGNENTQTWISTEDKQPGSPGEIATGNGGLESGPSSDSKLNKPTVGANTGSESPTNQVGVNGQANKTSISGQSHQNPTVVSRKSESDISKKDPSQVGGTKILDDEGRHVRTVNSEGQLIPVGAAGGGATALSPDGDKEEDHWNVGRFMTSHMTSVQNLLSGQTPVAEARSPVVFLTISFVLGIVVGYAISRSVGLFGFGSTSRTSILSLTPRTKAIANCATCGAIPSIEGGQCPTGHSCGCAVVRK